MSSCEITDEEIAKLPLYVHNFGVFEDCLLKGNFVARKTNRTVIVPFNGYIASIPAGGISNEDWMIYSAKEHKYKADAAGWRDQYKPKQ